MPKAWVAERATALLVAEGSEEAKVADAPAAAKQALVAVALASGAWRAGAAARWPEAARQADFAVAGRVCVGEEGLAFAPSRRRARTVTARDAPPQHPRCRAPELAPRATVRWSAGARAVAFGRIAADSVARAWLLLARPPRAEAAVAPKVSWLAQRAGPVGVQAVAGVADARAVALRAVVARPVAAAWHFCVGVEAIAELSAVEPVDAHLALVTRRPRPVAQIRVVEANASPAADAVLARAADAVAPGPSTPCGAVRTKVRRLAVVAVLAGEVAASAAAKAVAQARCGVAHAAVEALVIWSTVHGRQKRNSDVFVDEIDKVDSVAVVQHNVRCQRSVGNVCQQLAADLIRANDHVLHTCDDDCWIRVCAEAEVDNGVQVEPANNQRCRAERGAVCGRRENIERTALDRADVVPSWGRWNERQHLTWNAINRWEVPDAHLREGQGGRARRSRSNTL